MDLICYLYDGWKPRIRPASSRRDWMDATPESFAYRCLPLNIANAHGWEILSPCGFEAAWNGGADASDVTLRADSGTADHDAPVALFGQGTLTFHIAGLFRTPPGWNLWVGGPPNSVKDGIAPLGGIVETDWSPYTFTMNWRFTRPNHWVRFEADEVICHLFPVERRVVEAVVPRLVPIDDNPALKADFEAWSASRDAFHVEVRDNPPSRPTDKWQKLYYRGSCPSGKIGTDDHQSKLSLRPFVPPDGAAPVGEASPEVSHAEPLPSASAQDVALAKRNWLMETRTRLRALSPSASALCHYREIDRQTFLDRHYATNRPALLKGVVAHWPAVPRWSPDYLRRTIGDRPVEFQGDRRDDPRFELDKDAHRRTAPFTAYLDMVEAEEAGNNAYITAYNSGPNAEALAPLMPDIGTLEAFLNPADPGSKGMLWIGPAGTFTPLHHDLTNNLLIQITGRKRVVLVSPEDTPKLYNEHHVFSRVGDLEGNLDAFPYTAAVTPLVADLEPGDALFIPIGWWHQVRALDFSVSITNTNFVWPNSFYQSYPA
ncbi:cupin-like domain-containing protein [Sphingomonas sp. SUN039]|uniref:cupin-like domain-containing protein n=1 Tax=Sphingomonas sp. SUN039 TaxID=2937787 RepID=UPI0021645C15|nr:cupin-like domain-containing protein [Sphingomonas sp. SUN039]UVO55320.1 cupin-like domain-containing protein [Sphingomonas sp. SUN039]